jgi:hypothetical protein
MGHRFTQTLSLEYHKRMTIRQRSSQFTLPGNVAGRHIVENTFGLHQGDPYSTLTRARHISDKRFLWKPDSQSLVSGMTTGYPNARARFREREKEKGRGKEIFPAACFSRLGKLPVVNGTDQVAHRTNAVPVTGIGEATEVPAVLNGRQHGVVIERVIGTPGKAERVGNNESQDVPAAGICVAAATGIPKTSGASASEIAFIPGDEDDGIAGPCFGRHNGVDSAEKERIAGGDQRLDL